MRGAAKPECRKCKTTETVMWRKEEGGLVSCNSCYLEALQQSTTSVGGGSGRSTPQSMSDSSGAPSQGNCKSNLACSSQNSNNSTPSNLKEVVGTRKSSRIRPASAKGGARQFFVKALATKGKNRRVAFKRNPSKAPTAVGTIVTSESVYHKGYFYQVGDVVSLVDHEGGVYFAQIRGLLQDQYCEKSAVITWLLPTTATKRDSDPANNKFDPATYILGPEEDLPRKLDYMEFVCRAPSDYFKALNSPYPTESKKPDAGFIWTRVGPEICALPLQEDAYSDG